MSLAPNPLFPERAAQSFEGRFAPSVPGQEGTVRHYEGVASDTDVPSDFVRGGYVDTTSAAGRINHNNPAMVHKSAAETMQERAHLGSAAWEEAPERLGDFVQGAGAGQSLPQYEQIIVPGTRQARTAKTVITD